MWLILATDVPRFLALQKKSESIKAMHVYINCDIWQNKKARSFKSTGMNEGNSPQICLVPRESFAPDHAFIQCSSPSMIPTEVTINKRPDLFQGNVSIKSKCCLPFVMLPILKYIIIYIYMYIVDIKICNYVIICFVHRILYLQLGFISKDQVQVPSCFYVFLTLSRLCQNTVS